MKCITICLFAALLLLSVPAVKAAEGNAKFDEMVDKLLKAYNEDDAKAFFADYAKMMAAVATPQTFQALYTNAAKKDFGNYVSREPIKAETVAEGDFPLFVYQGKFEKNDKVKISVNFTKEDGAFKVMQVRIDKM